jgi:glycine/D-amino acid oxidase-like deaminating enzyme
VSSTRVLVVGAGVVGSSIGLELAKRGVTVALLDAATPGEGATHASFAWINASTKDPGAYFALNAFGLDAWERASRARPGLADYRRCGSHEWAADPQGAERTSERIARLLEVGYPVQRSTLSQLRDALGSVDTTDLVGDAAFYPTESVVDPDVVVTDTLEELREYGGIIAEQARVTRVDALNDGASRTTCADGRHFDADVVVLACGRGIDDLGSHLGLPALLAHREASSVRGATLHAVADGAGVRGVIRSPTVHLRPKGRTSLMIHADDVDVALSTGADQRWAVDVLVGRAEARIRQTVAPVSLRVADRVLPTDGVSIVGWLRALPRIYVAVTHSGITLARALGELACSEIVDDARDERLAPFRPERLVAPT